MVIEETHSGVVVVAQLYGIGLEEVDEALIYYNI